MTDPALESVGASQPVGAGATAVDDRGADAVALGLRDPGLYVNRELSWLDFNDRVLQLAEDDLVPLMERVKFLAIFVTNLDEFFMIRVAGVLDLVDARIDARGPDGLSPTETLVRIADGVRSQDRRHAAAFCDVIRPALARHGIRIVSGDESGVGADVLPGRFRDQIFPVLTPLAIGPGRPFPYISNLSPSLIVHLHDPGLDRDVFARVKVPTSGSCRGLSRSQRTRSFRWRMSSRRTWTRCSRGWRSSATPCSGSRATRTSGSPTRLTTCCRRSRMSYAGGGLAMWCASRSGLASIRCCGLA